MPNRRNLAQASNEIAAYLDKNPTDRGKGRGQGHDVSNEPRVPKGNTDGGQWTTTGSPGTAVPNRSSASRRGKTVTIIHPDGSTEIRTGESRSWRNNNPGNIQAGDWASRHGAIGSDGQRAIFPDEAAGTAAQEALLKGQYSGKTINDTIADWAPKEDGNDVARYQAFVRGVTGLSGTEKVGELTPEELYRLMNAQRRMEGWKSGTVGYLGGK